MKELSLELTPAEQRRFQRPTTASLDAYRAYSIGRLHMSRLRGDEIDKAIGHFKRAIELDPSDYEGAIRQLEHTLEIQPGFWIAHLNLGKTYELLRRYDEAEAHYRRALARSDRNLEPLSMIGHLHGIRGEEEQAQKIADELIGLSKERYVPATKIALVFTGMRRNAEAIEWLARACADRDVGMTFLKVNPRWDGLRDEPGFAAIEQCVGLPR